MYVREGFFRPLQALPRTLARALAEPRAAHRLVLGVIGLSTLGVMLYVGVAVVDTVTRDEWRFLPMLNDWYSGHFYVLDLFDTNAEGSAHRTPFYKLFLLVDALWFGLDVRLGCWFGALALGGFALALYRYHLRLRPEPASAFDHYAFLPVAINLFSFTQVHAYSYELLAVFTITGSAVFAVLWMRFDRAPRSDALGWRDAALGIGLFLALLWFGAGKGPALALATLTAALIAAWRPIAPRVLRMKRLAWIALGTLLAELLYWGGGISTVNTPPIGGLLAATFKDLSGAVEYVLTALGACLVDTEKLTSWAPPARVALLILLGALVLGMALGALAVYLRSRQYRRSALPPALATFVAAYLGELLLGRYGEGTLNGSSPRYVFTDHLLLTACLLVFADQLCGWYRDGRRRAALGALAALLLAVVAVESFNAVTAVTTARYVIRTQEQAVATARARLAGSQERYPAWYCPDPQLCDQGTRFLAEHRLSFMRQGKP